MQRSVSVLSIGESTVDAFMTLHDVKHNCHYDPQNHTISFPHGSKIDVDRYDFSLGGNATNVAVGLSRLGVTTALMSELGDDAFSEKIAQALEKEKIVRSYMLKTPHTAASFSVIFNFKGDRTIFVQDVERAHHFDFSSASATHIYLTSMGREWEHVYRKTLQFAVEHNAVLAFNPGSRQLREGRDVVLDVIAETDFLFLNKEEAEIILYGHTKPDEKDKEYLHRIMLQLQALGAKVVVMTNGNKGAYVLSVEGDFLHQAIIDAYIVERTGTGDAFTAGFWGGVLQGETLKDALLWGTLNAASVVGAIGAQKGLLTAHQMKERLQNVEK